MLSLLSCVTLDKSLGLSEPWVPSKKIRVIITAPGACELTEGGRPHFLRLLACLGYVVGTSFLR